MWDSRHSTHSSRPLSPTHTLRPLLLHRPAPAAQAEPVHAMAHASSKGAHHPTCPASPPRGPP